MGVGIASTLRKWRVPGAARFGSMDSKVAAMPLPEPKATYHGHWLR